MHLVLACMRGCTLELSHMPKKKQLKSTAVLRQLWQSSACARLLAVALSHNAHTLRPEMEVHPQAPYVFQAHEWIKLLFRFHTPWSHRSAPCFPPAETRGSKCEPYNVHVKSKVKLWASLGSHITTYSLSTHQKHILWASLGSHPQKNVL